VEFSEVGLPFYGVLGSLSASFVLCITYCAEAHTYP
jgi:hypothetical protein